METKSEKKIINVICMKFGTLYSAKYPNLLYKNIKKNTSFDIRFFCFTDNTDGLDKEIIAKPLPKFKNGLVSKYCYVKEAGLCDDNLAEELKGQRVFFFDLDVVITGNLDDIFNFPKGDEFYIIKDWNNNVDYIGQASCYSFVVGTLGYVKEYFEEHSEEIYKQFYTASQEYLSSKVIEKYGKLNFFPAELIKSFRFHCLPTPLIPFLRRFKMATIPKNARMIIFHGSPKMDDARKGIWNEHNIIKKIFYKHLRPVKWLDDYWKE